MLLNQAVEICEANGYSVIRNDKIQTFGASHIISDTEFESLRDAGKVVESVNFDLVHRVSDALRIEKAFKMHIRQEPGWRRLYQAEIKVIMP